MVKFGLKRNVSNIERFFKGINHRLDVIETTMIVVIFSLLLIMSGSQIVMRKFFNFGIQGLEILERNLVVWLGILGASLAACERRHISIDLTGKLIKHKVAKRVVTLVVSVVVIWVSWLFLYSSIEYISIESLSSFKRDIFNIPEWIFSTIFPFGFFLIIYHYFMSAFFALCDLAWGCEHLDVLDSKERDEKEEDK